MGNILDNINAASSGNPYKGSGTSNTQSGGNQTPIMGSPDILRHSLDSNPIISNPMTLNENEPAVSVPQNNTSE